MYYNLISSMSKGSIITNGLKLYLDAGNISSYPGSGTLWSDISGNSNNGTLINGPVYNPLNQGSIQFDAVDDYINVNTFNIPINFSLSVWCRIDYTNSDTFARIIEMGLNNYFTLCLNKIYSLNRYTFQLFDGNAHVSSNKTISLNYTCITIVNSNSLGTNTTNMYIDGNLDATNSKAGTFGANQNLYIGANPGAISSTGLKANISQILIYNRALSAAEVLQNYNASKGRYI